MSTPIKIASKIGLVAGRALRASMQGRVILPGDEDYGQARTVWNAAIDHHPAVIAQCISVRDVQLAVRAARTYGLPLSVRGGGHDWAGRAVRHGGLVIDLSAMRQVAIDPERGIAMVAGGALARDVIAAAEPHGLVAVTGACSSVGMAGLTMGGGYGALNGRYGLAADNLVGADVVLADGSVVAADARGGIGGNDFAKDEH